MIEIIPAMDIIGGKCVRLSQGDFALKTEYADDPVDTALRFRDAGLTRLHMVDLDGARLGSPHNLDTLRRVAERSALKIDFGGGVRTDADAADAFSAGAALINVTSVAVAEPERFESWIGTFGAERILLGADSRNGNIATNGWRNDTRLPVTDFIRRYAEKGVNEIFVTDIGRDGMMTGPNVDLYRQIVTDLPNVRLIASGGVRSIEDIEALDEAGCSGAIVGKALYEGLMTLSEISDYVGEKDNTLPRR